MNRAKPYLALRFGNVLLVRATVGNSSGGNQVGKGRLLVDTGASYTMLPVEMIEKLGYDTHHPLRYVRMTGANGIVVAPLVTVSWLNCLGQLLKNFPVVAHTIPEATFGGVIGMDFLTRCEAVIFTKEGKIACREPKAKK